VRISPTKIQTRSFSSSPISEHYPNVPHRQPATHAPSTPQLSTLENGVKVFSLGSKDATTASIGIFVNAGTRHETKENFGSVSLIRDFGFQSTTMFTGPGAHDYRERSALRFAREIELMGATYGLSSGREHLVWSSSALSHQVNQLVPLMVSATIPRFLEYEVRDSILEYSRLHHHEFSLSPKELLFELLHQEAFRNEGLGNPLYPPLFAVHEQSREKIVQFFKENFTLNKITVVGTGGVEHNHLVELVNKAIQQNHFDSRLSNSGTSSQSSSKYFGGEARVLSDVDTHVAVAFEGVSLGDADVQAAGVLQQALGGWNRAPASLGNGGASQIYRGVVAPSSDDVTEVAAFNISYSDSGLFGVYAITKNHADKVLINIANQLSVISKGELSDTALNAAKLKYKADVINSTEQRHPLLEFVGHRAAVLNVGLSPAAYVSGIDRVSASQVKNLARKIVKSRPTVAVIGDCKASIPTSQSIQELLS